MRNDHKARGSAPKSSQSKQSKHRRRRKPNRHGDRHHQRASDQSRRRRTHRSPSGRKKKSGKGIDPARFVNKAVAKEHATAPVIEHAFADFGLHPAIERNLASRGFRTPTPIQDRSILPIMHGRDLIGIANTGTGKTAAFALPMIHQLVSQEQSGQALILAPTRELAGQIEEETKLFAKGLPVRATLLIGGMSMQKQLKALRQKPNVLIATPGRLLDLIQQKHLSLGRVTFFVLDEMDRMLDMGFIKDIQKVIAQLPEQKQTLCFSATMPEAIRPLLDELLHNPVTVSVQRRETAEHIHQDVVVADTKEEKLKVLQELLREQHYTKVLVFGRTKWGVQKLAQKLVRSGITAEAIHGNKSQPQRIRALNAFKDGTVSTLVATDVAARGLDIDDVSHVINFDQPATHEDYVHRIGRTGRAGKQGHALTFVTSEEAKRTD